MLVDGGAGLNLISPIVVRRLQISDEDFQETGTFQGINQGRSQPKGKVTLLVMFGGDLNYRTEKIVFMLPRSRCHIMGSLAVQH